MLLLPRHCVVAVGLALMSAIAAADTPALTFSSVSVAGDPGVNFGWTFDATQALTVSALGAYAVPSGSPATVGIWDSGGNLLAQATVSDTDPIVSGFNFKAITPLSLPVATGYVVGCFFPPTPGGPIGFSATGLATVPGVSYVSGAWQAAASFAEPIGDAFSGGLAPAYFGPNFLISAATPVRLESFSVD